MMLPIILHHYTCKHQHQEVALLAHQYVINYFKCERLVEQEKSLHHMQNQKHPHPHLFLNALKLSQQKHQSSGLHEITL